MRKTMATLMAAGALMAGDLQVGELKQHAELGYLGTTGNSKTQTFNALYSNAYRWTEMTHFLFRADANYGKQDGEKTAERYRAHAQVNHVLDEKLFAYAEVGALRNTFEGFEQQYNAGAGLGYTVLDDATQLLKLRAGYQYRYANLTTGDDEDYHYFKFGANHEYRFNEKTSLVSELNFLDNLEDTSDYEAVFRTGLKTALVENFSLRVGFEVKYDNTPVEDHRKTDTTTTVGIVYDF